MNIAFLMFTDYPWRSGGVNQSLDNLAGFLARAGHGVTAVCLPDFTHRRTAVYRPESSGVRILAVDEPWLRYRDVRFLGGMATSRALSAFPHRAVDRMADAGEKPDVCVADFTCARAALAYGRAHDVPVVVLRWAHWADEIAGAGRFMRLISSRLHAVERAVLAQVQALVVDGPDLEEDAVRAGVEPGRICLIPSAVDTARFAPRPDRSALLRQLDVTTDHVVLFPSMLRDIKGFDHLLRAFAQLPEQLVATSLIAATGRGEAGVYRGLASELGIAEKVRFLGEVSNDVLSAWFAAADVAAFPYLFGAGYSVAGIEALAAGIPIVAYDVQAFSGIVENGVTGRLVPVGDVDGLARSLEELLSDPALRARMGASARERAAEFSIETVGARFEQLLACVVAGGAPCAS
jgi:D-inositol-3-phosphate glycosyltransferase